MDNFTTIMPLTQYEQYVQSELALIEDGDDAVQTLANENILEICKVFARQGHSCLGANYVINTLDRLLRAKPLTPLTGKDDEWVTIVNDPACTILQNRRCRSVLKNTATNESWDEDAVLYSEDGGISWWYCGGEIGHKPISFPYMPPHQPERVYIDWVDKNTCNYQIITGQPNRIKELRERRMKEYEQDCESVRKV